MPLLLKVSDNYQPTIVGNFSKTATTITVSAAPVKTEGYLTVFDLDGNQLEKIKYTGVSSLDLTGCLRGLSFTEDGDTEITANQKELKNGMGIKMVTTHLYLNPIINILNGTSPLPAVLTNPAVRSIVNQRDVTDKEYVDGVAIAGGADASLITKGISKLSLDPLVLSSPIAVGDNDPRVPTQDENDALVGTGTPSSSNKYVTEDTIGQQIDGKKTLVSGETINGATLPVAVYQEDGDYAPVLLASMNNAQGNDTDINGVNWAAQTFLLGADVNTLTKVVLRLKKVLAPSGNIDVSIYAVDGSNKPTGAALGTKSVAASTIPTSDTDVEFEFASSISVSPSTTYAIVVSVPSGDGSNYIEWDFRTTSAYADGGKNTSSDSGVSWGTVSATDDYYFEVYGYSGLTTNYIAACDTDNVNKLIFIGFAITNAVASGAIDVQFNGIVSGFTGLEEGKKYYVQDDKTIGLIPGTRNILVGIAISETELVILKKGMVIHGTGSRSTGEATKVIDHNLGVIPSSIKLKAVLNGNSGGTSAAIFSIGKYDGGNQSSVIYKKTGNPDYGGSVASDKLGQIGNTAAGGGGVDITVGTITKTQFTLTFNVGSGDDQDVAYLWEAEE